MKRLLQKIGWVLNRIAKTPRNILSWVARATTPMVAGRVVCWSHNFRQYGCNPRYLTEYLLEHNPEFELCWVFRKGVDTSQVPEGVRVVRFRTWEYLRVIASAEFLVTNARTDPYRNYWHKRPGQKYLMLWHAGVALKRIEADVEDRLSFSYVQRAKADSRVCDLMISGCRMQTTLQQERFWYDGEILEAGIPRNDIFFAESRKRELRRGVAKQYGIDPACRMVLYAPTFRVDSSTKPYEIDWAKVMPAISRMYGGDGVAVMVRMHPNLIGKVDSSSLVAYDNVWDVTRYPDMQELLTVADMLITDYSSSMFDFAMQSRPCLLYATDVDAYDRGFYFDIRELPFPLAESEDELMGVIESFDMEGYKSRVSRFYDERVGLVERGCASEALAKWMVNHRV